MKQYEVLMAKKLFAGSDIIRSFGYKAARLQDNYALFWKTDCFVFHSPYDVAGSFASFLRLVLI